MTDNNTTTTPDFSKMTHLERQMYFSSMKSELWMPTQVNRPAPRERTRRRKRRTIR